MSTSKTGKHGHAKVHLVAIDVRIDFFTFLKAFLTCYGRLQIFTAKKMVRFSVCELDDAI